MLSEYVERLEAEEKERKDLQELLEAFMWQHRQQLKDAKKKLKVSLSLSSPDIAPCWRMLSQQQQQWQSVLHNITL